MKRKKFIKMLMWAGMSRNDAADVAHLAQEAWRPYFLVLGDLLNFHRQDFGNPLVWMKMRRTIIYGYGTPEWRFFEKIDEVHEMDGSEVATALEAGMAVKPCPVVVVPGTVALDGEILNGIDFEWPPQPQPAASCLYAIDTTPPEDTGKQWRKNDALDALRYAIEAMNNRQRGVLGQ